MVSIHALLAECDSSAPCSSHENFTFQSTHSLRSATILKVFPRVCSLFQSTHSLRSATHLFTFHFRERHVSIHALLAECDLLRWRGGRHLHGFNPRTPCGVRPCRVIVGARTSRFQSTHSLRSATVGTYLTLSPFWFQSTHSLRSATSCFSVRPASQTGFNPRTPCGVRLMAIWSLNRTVRFQSTHSLRSATGLVIGLSSTRAVSIHALLAECDGRCLGTMSFHGSFNPRTPCGVRPDTGTGTTGRRMFQSTHSLRSATGCLFAIKTSMIVSIHALLAECDPIFRFHVFILTCFNPRTPCGVRLS